MNSFSSLIFLILALCADTFTASFVYGAEKVRIPLSSIWIITLLSTGILVTALEAGAAIKLFLPDELPMFFSSSLLVLLGASRFTAVPTKDMAVHANRMEPEVLSPSEAFFLGIGLSIDNAAAGLGTGLSGAPFPLVAFLSLSLSFAAVTAGFAIGKRAVLAADLDFSRCSGIVLVILGLLKLI